MDKKTFKQACKAYDDIELREKIQLAMSEAGQNDYELRLRLIDNEGARYQEITLTPEIRECLIDVTTKELDKLRQRFEELTK